jgi:hypothetical protein
MDSMSGFDDSVDDGDGNGSGDSLSGDIPTATNTQLQRTIVTVGAAGTGALVFAASEPSKSGTYPTFEDLQIICF